MTENGLPMSISYVDHGRGRRSPESPAAASGDPVSRQASGGAQQRESITMNGRKPKIT